MRDIVQELAEDVANSLLQELKTLAYEDNPDSAKAAEELAEGVGKEVAEDMAEHLLAVSEPSSNPDDAILQRMTTLERKVERLLKRLDRPSQEQNEDSLPNLKYAKSKYKNVESLLNYVENKEADGGIKLVIINFND